MSLNDTVKKVAKGYLESLKLTDIMYAAVTNINPLEVLVDQRLPFDEDFLIVPEHLIEYKVAIGAQEITIRRGLEIGDKLIVVRQHGGLNYAILGRLPE